MKPPPLRNDCFSMPPGVHWTPVDEALALLRERMHAVVGSERLPLAKAAGRILAATVVAKRANPPAANSAVDGYGFAHASLATGAETIELPLIDGRAAAGLAYEGTVPAGRAIRILTGATLPEGVDTVVLEEDTTTEGNRIAFRAGLKPRANTRRAGEDVEAGQTLFSPGRIIGPQDLAVMAATGHGEVEVHARLRVGVLSTGDEICPAGEAPRPGMIFDANRPMLLALLARWGMEAVDLGHARDSRDALRESLDDAAGRCDAVVTSGGASAGDEDHLSAILSEEGTLHAWRIAMKPGRPLALGMWQNMPLFGLPGNPVAAFVCTLVFARPALVAMAGGAWCEPTAFVVPAGFSKSKKQGRREYLRARINAEGSAEVYRSEGSGRIYGLSWAEGLVELSDDAHDFEPGDPVRFLPYGGFGL